MLVLAESLMPEAKAKTAKTMPARLSAPVKVSLPWRRWRRHPREASPKGICVDDESLDSGFAEPDQNAAGSKAERESEREFSHGLCPFED
jgi:hypothetical protein